MNQPRCAFDRHAGLMVVYPPEGPPPARPYPWHLVVFAADAQPGRHVQSYYAGIYGIPTLFAVVRTPPAERFTLCFLAHEDVARDAACLDNPRRSCHQISFDALIEVFGDADDSERYQIETDLFQYQATRDGTVSLRHQHFPRTPLPPNPKVV